ncbi:uncharacterized protein LOC132725150 [Ruditapes philippinarum]|uniref:uncharacterized protein LOC132725150 n=1 Tax=Ruditapes philippinarum TaxID=129788 RepID=UPI00295AF3FB|nr:uncharacterized protein LOC132725150 [Ruditapes philippinarum]
MGIEKEVNSLLEEINEWNDTKPLKEAKGNACKEVEALRESRLKLHKRKLDFKSGHDKEDVARNEKQSQDQVIKEIWTMIRPTSDKVKSGGDDIGNLLVEIKKYVSDAQIRLDEFNEYYWYIKLDNKYGTWYLESLIKSKLDGEFNESVFDYMVFLSAAKLSLEIPFTHAFYNLVFDWRIRKIPLTILYSGQHDKEERVRNEKQSQEQVIMIQEILTIIGSTSGKVISGGDEIGTGLTVIKKYVSNAQGRLAEFNKIEKPLFDVEERSNILFSDLTGTHHSKSDEQRSPVDTCKSILKVLDNCKTETETLVEIVSRLEVDLNIDRKSGSVKSDSVSNRCKAIKETVEKRKQMFDEMQSMLDMSTNSLTLLYSELLEKPYLFLEPQTNVDSIRRKVPEWLHGHAALIDRIRACTRENKKSFQLRYVRKEDYNNLKDQMRTLHEEMRQLREDKESAYNRLSKVAGARLTDNNPNIADLSDPNRPTKIAEQYSELYDTPWTDAFEVLGDKDQENTDFLLKIIVDCYEICGKISMNHQRNLKNAVCYPANNIEDGQASEQKKGKTESPVSFSAVQSKALSELRKQTADISVVNVISQIELARKDWFVPEKLRSYTTRCIELCWLMHVQTPPVIIDMCAKPGSNFDTSRYKQYTKAGKKIDFVVWPVLLLEEGGAILCKGVAQGK